MDAKKAIDCINHLFINHSPYKKRLSDLDEAIIHGCWYGKTYQQIAKQLDYEYSEGHIRNSADKIWQKLSLILDEKVRRNTLKPAVKNWYEYEGINILSIPESYYNDNKNEFLDLLSADNYVKREEEKQCYDALLRPKTCLRLKGLTQVGKTEMIQRVLASLQKEKQYRYIYLSLKELEKEHLEKSEKLIHWFAQKMTTQLNYNYQFSHYWQKEGLGPISQCTEYVEKYLLSDLNTPLVLCVDDVHLLLPYPKTADTFFRMLRSWLEKEGLVWRQKLRLAILYTTDIYTSFSINRSPLNIGIVLEVSDFSNEEVHELVETYDTIKNSQLGRKGITPLTKLVNNNPYLLKIALDYLSLSNGKTLSDILDNAATDVGIYQSHLRDLWLKLNENSDLENLFKKVIISPKRLLLSPDKSNFLQRMGLVKGFNDGVEPRCELYRKYFNYYWK